MSFSDEVNERLTRSLARGGRVEPVTGPVTGPVSEPARPAASGLPTVSVVVPCYNYGHFLPECVRSILEQPGVDVDVLIVDDCSPDGSADVARALAAADSRVDVIAHTENQGHIRTYNEGLARAKGDYLVLLSADDLLTPGALGRATALMEAHPEVGLVYGHPEVFFDEVPAGDSPARSWTVWSGPEWIRAQCRRAMSCIYSPEAVVRTRVHHEVGYYDPALPHSGDLEMWLRVAAVAGVGRVNGATQALRREHPASMMHTTYADALDDLRERGKAFDTFFRATDDPAVQALEPVYRRYLAREVLGAASHALSLGMDEARAGDYLGYARELDPAETAGWAGQEVGLRIEGAHGRLDRARLGVWERRRDLESRLRWQRWRRTGV
jgi:glycosyltransferase involved in cell wall biosynthesis